MVYLQVENISKSYGDRTLFSDISFGIDQGDRVALIAQNGMGKSTLISILTGKEAPDSGIVTYRKDIRIGCLVQEPNFAANMTVAEACFASNSDVVKAIQHYEELIENHASDPLYANQIQVAMANMDRLNAWDYETRIKQILGKLDIHNFDKQVSQLSGGQQKRLALANVLITEPDFLLLDEPTNHLDLAMVEWLEEYLNHSKMTILMVTHDRYFLDDVCTGILEIDNNRLYHYRGNYSYYLEKREERIANFNAETARAQNIYRTELEWIRRQPQARGHKARSRINSFYDIEQRAKQRMIEKSVTLGIKSAYLGSKIFEAQYISKSYDNQVLFKDFYYNFARYEKLGIIGKNGTGKSTFLKMLLGEVKPDQGQFVIGETVKFAYYSQSGLKFNESMKVIDAVREIADEVDLGSGKRMTATQFLTHFLFPPEKQHNYIAKLSGGERRRLYLCTVLMRSPNFLILDEPTNDLDIATLNVLEDYLIHFKGCVIVVSHDRFFMDKVVDHLLVLKGGGEIKDFPGNYTDYRDWNMLQLDEIAKQKETERRNTHPKKSVEASPQAGDGKRKKSYKERLEYQRLETEIEQLETEKSDIETKLSSGSLNNDEILHLSQRFSELNELIDEKSIRWLELSELD